MSASRVLYHGLWRQGRIDEWCMTVVLSVALPKPAQITLCLRWSIPGEARMWIYKPLLLAALVNVSKGPEFRFRHPPPPPPSEKIKTNKWIRAPKKSWIRNVRILTTPTLPKSGGNNVCWSVEVSGSASGDGCVRAHSKKGGLCSLVNQ